MWKQIALLAVAGGLGTVSRYGLTQFVQRYFAGTFPWGTLAVNLLGCFLFGLVWSLAEHRAVFSGPARFLLLTGFLGAFTTFSTFAFESHAFLQNGEFRRATENMMSQNVGGLLAVYIGIAVSKWFHGP